jgi:hypothetical protein
MDLFLRDDAGSTGEITIETTPNIEFQLSKYSSNEYLNKKNIPEFALFIHPTTLSQMKNIYSAYLDMPLLVHGFPSCGKLTAVLGLLPNIPSYLQDLDIPTTEKVNNLEYFKILDAEFSKVLTYENIYYLNLAILNNHTERIDYLNYINGIAKSRGFIEEKKIIILNHIDQCTAEEQRYVSYMIDKMNDFVSYIFIANSVNRLNKKVLGSSAKIYFKPLDELYFTTIFKNCFGMVMNKKQLSPNHLKHYYKIYESNKYNIGSTISQIKYYLDTAGTDFIKDKNISSKSLMGQIAANFIKKKLVLSTVGHSAMEIRKFLYTLISLDMNMTEFVKIVVDQLLSKNKFDKDKKIKIVALASELSSNIKYINKEIVIIEQFFYNIVELIYS